MDKFEINFIKMARHLSAQEIISGMNENGFLQNAKIENVEGLKYDFRISSRVLKAKFHQPIDINNLGEQQKANIFIEPGEVVFVLTEETISLPKNIKAQLLPKRKMSHDGIITLGGLSIDPLYKGRLLIGLYNFSSSAFPLMPGKKLIAAHFFQLDESEVDDFLKPESEITDFPEDLIKLMSRYTPVSYQSLAESTKVLEQKFDELRNEFRQSNDWFKQFQKSLEGHDKSIEKIITTLEREIDERKSKELDLEKRQVDDYKKLHDSIGTYAEKAYKIAGVIGTIGALIVTLLIFALQKFLEK